MLLCLSKDVSLVLANDALMAKLAADEDDGLHFTPSTGKSINHAIDWQPDINNKYHFLFFSQQQEEVIRDVILFLCAYVVQSWAEVGASLAKDS